MPVTEAAYPTEILSNDQTHRYTRRLSRNGEVERRAEAVRVENIGDLGTARLHY